MTMYSYRSDGTVTKFDTDGNIESSYTVSEDACTCPAGHRHTCRHRQMLPDLIHIADTHWFLDWDCRAVVDFNGTPKWQIEAVVAGPIEQTVAQDTNLPIESIKYTTNYMTDGSIEQFTTINLPTKNWRRL